MTEPWDRHRYLPALCALPASEVLALAGQCSQGWERRHHILPEQGLGLLQLQDSTRHEAFYLGEFPVAQAWVELHLPDGRRAQGAAHVMQDNAELAEALAVCDAILDQRLPGWEALLPALRQGEAIRAQLQANRKAMLASTRVDFSLLATTEDGA